MRHHLLVRRSVLGLALAGATVLAACSSPPPPPPPAVAGGAGSTEGTITFTGGAVAAGVGVQWGNGVLTFRGQQFPFRVTGLSIIDVGMTRVSGSGTVRNLNNVADFAGNYVALQAGATLAGGASVGSMRNQNGVVIDGVSTSQGARLSLAPAGVNITLTR